MSPNEPNVSQKEGFRRQVIFQRSRRPPAFKGCDQKLSEGIGRLLPLQARPKLNSEDRAFLFSRVPLTFFKEVVPKRAIPN